MPHIIVTADQTGDPTTAVMLRERVSVADLESKHFATHLVERIGWAVGDAADAERAQGPEVSNGSPAGGGDRAEESDGEGGCAADGDREYPALTHAG